MIYGPFCPFTSQPLVHEWQVNWFADLVAHARASGKKTVDVSPETEKAWVKVCVDGAAGTLFARTDSWINGTNIPGKPRAAMFYMGGMAELHERAGPDGQIRIRGNWNRFLTEIARLTLFQGARPQLERTEAL